MLERLDDEDFPALTMGQATELLGVQPSFLRSLDAADVLHPYRSTGGHRRYSRRQLALAVRLRELTGDGHPWPPPPASPRWRPTWPPPRANATPLRQNATPPWQNATKPTATSTSSAHAWPASSPTTPRTPPPTLAGSDGRPSGVLAIPGWGGETHAAAVEVGDDRVAHLPGEHPRHDLGHDRRGENEGLATCSPSEALPGGGWW